MRNAIVFPLVLLILACTHGLPPNEHVETNPAIASGVSVLVLGTAQDGGLPQIGCNEKICTDARAHPHRRRLVTSLLLCDDSLGQRWLFDASPDLKDQVERSRGWPASRRTLGARPALFDGIFLTHAHSGHYTGLLHLGRESYGSKNVPLYGTPRMCRFLTDNGPWSQMVSLGQLDLRPVEFDRPVAITHQVSVTPIGVPHRDEFTDTAAFLIRGPRRSLLYLPDIDKWEKWDRKIEDYIAQVDFALLDGTFFADGEIPGRGMKDIPHPFIEESLARFAALPRSERMKIHFTHLNHTNPASDPESAAARRIRTTGMKVVNDGDVFGL